MPKLNKNNIKYTAWYCPKGEMGHFVCYMATQKQVDEHLKSCNLAWKKQSLNNMKTLEEKKPKETEVSIPIETLEDRLKRIEHKIEMIWLEVFQASSTNIDTTEHKIHLKGRVDKIEEKLNKLL